MADQNLVAKDGIAPVPEEIKELWGSPPILRSENVETYYRLAAHFARTVKPHDIMEWFWLKDILDLTSVVGGEEPYRIRRHIFGIGRARVGALLFLRLRGSEGLIVDFGVGDVVCAGV